MEVLVGANPGSLDADQAMSCCYSDVASKNHCCCAKCTVNMALNEGTQEPLHIIGNAHVRALQALGMHRDQQHSTLMLAAYPAAVKSSDNPPTSMIQYACCITDPNSRANSCKAQAGKCR